MFEAVMNSAAVLVESVRALDAIGVALYAVVFLLATLAFTPASPLTAIAGFLYGQLWGTLLVSPVGIASAALAFFIGRHLARPWVRRRLCSRPRLAAVGQAVAHGGFRIVFLLRLASIVPFAPLSYVLGASRISGRDFLLASWLGLLPGTFLYVYLGSLVSNVDQILRGEVATGSDTRALTAVGWAVAVLALLITAHYARNTVQQSIEKKSEHEQTF